MVRGSSAIFIWRGMPRARFNRDSPTHERIQVRRVRARSLCRIVASIKGGRPCDLHHDSADRDWWKLGWRIASAVDRRAFLAIVRGRQHLLGRRVARVVLARSKACFLEAVLLRGGSES